MPVSKRAHTDDCPVAFAGHAGYNSVCRCAIWHLHVGHSDLCGMLGVPLSMDWPSCALRVSGNWHMRRRAPFRAAQLAAPLGRKDLRSSRFFPVVIHPPLHVRWFRPSAVVGSRPLRYPCVRCVHCLRPCPVHAGLDQPSRGWLPWIINGHMARRRCGAILHAGQ